MCHPCFPLGQVSKLNVADLAGSERVGKTGSSGETLEEAKKINASLSSLCMVIGALSEAKPHVPYRNSKLTRILQESLGGNSKTALLVTCSPAADNLHETTSSLRFARQAKKIQNVAVVNRVQSKAQLQADNLALQKELGEARAQLAAGGGGGGAAGGVGKALEGKALEAAAAPLLAEVAQLKEAAAAREGEAIQLQHELEEEQQAAVQLRAELAEHEADGKQLQATVARFQVLHGVAPTRVRESREGRALGGALDQLRRLLVEAEGQAMQRELSGADDESEAKSQAERLRGQLAQQHARIVELEGLAEAGAGAQAARQEAAMLREQLQQLTRQKLQAHIIPEEADDDEGGDGEDEAATLSLCTRTGKMNTGADDCFRTKEAFGQHLLKKANTPGKGPRRTSSELRRQLRASFGTPSGRPSLGGGRSSLGGGDPVAAAALEAAQQQQQQQQQEALEKLQRELTLERSRRQALERKVEGLPQAEREPGTPRQAGQEKERQRQRDQRRETMLQQRQRDAEVVEGDALCARAAAEARLYSGALREAEAEAARAKTEAFHLVAQHAAVEHLLRGEVRRCEAECGAARRRRALSTDTAPAAAAAAVAAGGEEEEEEEEAVVVMATPYAQRKREHATTDENVKTEEALVTATTPAAAAAAPSAKPIVWHDAREMLTPGAFSPTTPRAETGASRSRMAAASTGASSLSEESIELISPDDATAAADDDADDDDDAPLPPPPAPAAASATAAACAGSVCIARRGRNARRSVVLPAAAAPQEAPQPQQAAPPPTPTPPTPAPPPPDQPPPPTPASSGSDGSDAAPPPPPAGPPPPTPPPPAGPPPPTPPGSTRSKLPRATKATGETKDENRNPQRKKRTAVEPEPAAVRAGGRRNR